MNTSKEKIIMAMWGLSIFTLIITVSVFTGAMVADLISVHPFVAFCAAAIMTMSAAMFIVEVS